MNKKLLLSFAVFAASFGVNAQNFVEKDVLSAPVKIKKESQKRTWTLKSEEREILIIIFKTFLLN